jgi:hypothetical protein
VPEAGTGASCSDSSRLVLIRMLLIPYQLPAVPRRDIRRFGWPGFVYGTSKDAPRGEIADDALRGNSVLGRSRATSRRAAAPGPVVVRQCQMRCFSCSFYYRISSEDCFQEADPVSFDPISHPLHCACDRSRFVPFCDREDQRVYRATIQGPIRFHNK